MRNTKAPARAHAIAWRPYAVYTSLMVACLITAVCGQLTLSSIGILSESGAVDTSVVRGMPQPIRSDEYFRGSPREIGLLRNFDSHTFLTPFDAASGMDTHSLSARSNSAIRIVGEPERNIGRRLLRAAPLGMQFAYSSLITSFIFLLAFPLFVRLIGVRWLVGIIGAWLIWLSAPNQWWSTNPMDQFAPAAASGALILLGTRLYAAPSSSLRRLAGIAIIIAGGGRVAALALGYAPWSLPVLGVFAAILLGAVLGGALGKREKVVVLFTAAGSAMIAGAFALWSNAQLLRAIADTVYPGTRRFAGGASLPLFAGDMAGSLVRQGSQLISSNQSELALGLTVALPLSIIALVVSTRRARRMGSVGTSLLLGIVASGLFWLWTAGAWPAPLLSSNPLVLVSPDRIVQIFGMVALVIYVITIEYVMRSRFSPIRRALIAIAGGSAVLLLGFRDGRLFAASYMPILSARDVAIASLVTAGVLVIPLTCRRQGWALAPLVVWSAFLVYQVNPVQFGTGALTNSAPAQAIVALNAATPGRWASDDIADDPLILAAGVPQLSGQQFTGPDRATWARIDPTGSAVNQWNRGAAFVTFRWDDAMIPAVSNPSADIIAISGSPCSPTFRDLDLRWVLASSPLTQGCLTMAGAYLWRGNDVFLYRVDD